MPDGRLITLEGGEGAGKTTAIAQIHTVLRHHQIDFIATREPGGTPLGEALRTLLLTPQSHPIDPLTELLLIFAARRQHLTEVIQPALQAGVWVVSDRFIDASYAYQGGGRQLPLNQIDTLTDWTLGALTPDLTLYLDLPVAQGMARVVQRGEKDRFEQEQHAFFERVRHHYRQRVAADPNRCTTIDASQPLEAVTTAIRHAVEQFLERHR